MNRQSGGRGKRYPSAAVISYCRKMISFYEEWLDRLHIFVRRTDYLYEKPQFDSVDRTWLNRIAEENAACTEAEAVWKEAEERRYWNEEQTARFWQEAEHFEAYWWQDEEKLEMAYKALRYEAERTGGIDVRAEAFPHNAENPSQKILAIQAIFNATRSGYYDENLLSQMEIIMADNGRDIHEMDQILDKEALDIGWKEYQNIIWKESGNFLERYPELRDAAYNTATGSIEIHSAGQWNQSVLESDAVKRLKEVTRRKVAQEVKIEGGLDVVDDIAEATRKIQKSIIESVENRAEGSKGLTNLQKGNYGEMKMDDFFESQGYDRISADRVADLDAPTHQGIDGVYYNPDGHPPYIIGEAKYGSSKLGSTLDGKQMSDNWVDKRLVDAVGEEMADDIILEMMLNPDNVQKQLINISADGDIITKILDEYANVVK